MNNMVDLKKKLALMICSAVLLSSLPANPAFAEKALRWVVEPTMVYDYIYGFNNGLSGVRRGGDNIRYEDNDGSKSYDNNYHGVINDQGKEIIPCSPDNPKYGWGDYMGGGYAWRYSDGKTVVYDYNGDVASILPYDNLSHFSDEVYETENESSIKLLDINGGVILSVDKDAENNILYRWGNSLVEVCKSGENYTHIDLYDLNGNLVFGGMDHLGEFYNYTTFAVTHYIIKDGKYALIDNDANLISERYDSIERLKKGIYYISGFLKTTNRDKCGVIGMDGTTIVPCEYDSFELTDNYSFLVTKNGKKGIIDKTGNIIVPCEYDSVKETEIYDKPCYIVGNGGLSGIIGDYGQIITPIIYFTICTGAYTINGHEYFDYAVCEKEKYDNGESLFEFVNYYGKIVYDKVKFGAAPNPPKKIKDNCYVAPHGLIDYNGNVILEWYGLNDAVYLNDNIIFLDIIGQIYCLYYTDTGNIEDVYMNINGNIEFPYYAVGVDDTGLIIVSDNEGRYGVIDINRNWIMPIDEQIIHTDHDSNIYKPLFVRRNGKEGAADRNGNLIVPCEFNLARLAVRDNLIYGIKGNDTYYGYFSDSGKLIAPCIYSEIEEYENSIMVKKDNKYGIISKNGGTILDCVYDSVRYDKNGNIKACAGNKYGLFTPDGKPILPMIYDNIELGAPERLIVVKDGKYGLVDYNGNIVLPFEYDDIYYNQNGKGGSVEYYEGCNWCVLYKNSDRKSLYGLADISGNIILPCEYASTSISGDTITVKTKDGLWGIAEYNEPEPAEIISEVRNDQIAASVKNGAGISGTMGCAFYKDGVLVKFETKDYNGFEDETVFEIPNVRINSYKLFLWKDMNSAEPLACAISGYCK